VRVSVFYQHQVAFEFADYNFTALSITTASIGTRRFK